MNIAKKISFRNNLILILIFFAIAFIALMFGSYCSFLYAEHQVVDLNWYITIGRGILNGLLPYRDLYEQKGPIIYFISAFLCLFKSPYRAFFVLEIITLTSLMFISFKLLRKFFNKYFSFLFASLFAFLIAYTSLLNNGGGSIEEYVLPILMYFMYVGVEYFQGKKISKTRAFLLGFWISIIFWSKYTILVPIFLMFVIWFFVTMAKKEVKRTFIIILWMIVGFLIPSIFVLAYFAANHAINDIFICYFYNNIFLYDKGMTPLLFISMLLNVNYRAESIIVLLLPIVLLIRGFIREKDKKAANRSFLYFLFTFVFYFSIIMTAWTRYYFIPLLIAYPFSLIAFYDLMKVCNVKEIKKLIEKFSKNRRMQKTIASLVLIVSLGVGIAVGAISVRNRYVAYKDRESTMIYSCARVIESYRIENPILLEYALDYGLYNICNSLPSEKYFCYNNFEREDFPEMFESLDQTCVEGRADFVLCWTSDFTTRPEIYEKYTEIYSRDWLSLLIKTSLLETYGS